MIRDITLGQYYPADSVLHRMDPRAKLVGTHGIYYLRICISYISGICSSDYCFWQA